GLARVAGRRRRGQGVPRLRGRPPLPRRAARPVPLGAAGSRRRRERRRGPPLPRRRRGRRRRRLPAARCRAGRRPGRAGGAARAGPPVPCGGTDMTGYDVVTFGEAMASLHGPGPLRMGGDLTLSVAGAEANVAIGLARLGHAVRWAGVLGDDELGRLILRTLRAEAVDVTACRLDPSRPTGLLLQERRIGDIIRVHYYRAGSAGS